MLQVLKYKIYCETEKKDKDWYLESKEGIPKKCPNISTHTVGVAVLIDTLDAQTATEKADSDKILNDLKLESKDLKTEREALKTEIKNIKLELQALVPRKYDALPRGLFK